MYEEAEAEDELTVFSSLPCGCAGEGFGAGDRFAAGCCEAAELAVACDSACTCRGCAILSSAFPATSAALRHSTLPVTPMPRIPATRVFKPRTRTIRSVSRTRVAD